MKNKKIKERRIWYYQCANCGKLPKVFKVKNTGWPRKFVCMEIEGFTKIKKRGIIEL